MDLSILQNELRHSKSRIYRNWIEPYYWCSNTYCWLPHPTPIFLSTTGLCKLTNLDCIGVLVDTVLVNFSVVVLFTVPLVDSQCALLANFDLVGLVPIFRLQGPLNISGKKKKLWPCYQWDRRCLSCYASKGYVNMCPTCYTLSMYILCGYFH